MGFGIIISFTNWCYNTAMKRATITLPDDLEKALAEYTQDQEVSPTLTGVVQAALRQYLAARGYIVPAQPLRITPARFGSGDSKGSIEHDRVLTER